MTPQAFAEYNAARTLAQGVRARDRATLGRAITLIESQRPADQIRAQVLLELLDSSPVDALRLGISGPPGAGKSSLIEALGCRIADAGHHIAVLAVDPSSQISGGSILGDKTRMMRLANHPNAFIRPSPNSDHPGGITRRTREAALICAAAGFDIIIIETVGIGQSESAVADIVDLIILLVLARAGDEMQAIKRGVLELADIVAVTKADGDNLAAAQEAQRTYNRALKHRRGGVLSQDPPAVIATSTRDMKSLDALWSAIQDRYKSLKASGALQKKRQAQRINGLWSEVQSTLIGALRKDPTIQKVTAAIEEEVALGRASIIGSAQKIVEHFLAHRKPPDQCEGVSTSAKV